MASTEQFPSPTWRERLRDVPLVDFMLRQPQGTISGLFILTLLVVALFADVVAPYDPLDVDFVAMLQPPSLEHLLGTDNVGRDILSRIVYGARTALAIGFLASFIGCTIGALIGAASAYFGGRIDLIVQRIVDVAMVFPIIMLALVIVAILGRNLVLGIDINLILAIALPIAPKVARVIRASALSIVNMPYIDAARAAGYSHARIILRHMMPNVVGPYLVLLTAYIAQAILTEASLSFLGLGVSEPQPAWGLMLSSGSASYYRDAPWMVLFPGLAISLAVLAFNLFGDAMRDWLDPRLQT